MANDKSYDRHINIWINGKEVKNDVASIKKEMFNLTNELSRATRGTKEYNEKAAALRKVKAILKEHQDNISATGGAWTKLKGIASSGMGIITAGIAGIVGAYHSVKAIIFSTDALGDKFKKTLGGWKGGLDAIARSIASMDFKNFGKNIKDAIEEGRRYAESQDKISDSLRALKFREAEVSSEILRQRAIENSALKSNEERIAAGKKAIALEDELQKTRTDIARERYNVELENAMVITGQAPNIIEAYIRQDSELMKLLNTGEQYKTLQQKIADLHAQEETSRVNGVRQIDNTALIQAAKQQLAGLDPMAAEYEKMFTGLGKLVDEKKDLIVSDFEQLKQAETSNLENTMKIRTKTDNLIAKDEKELTDFIEKGNKKKIDSYDLLNAKMKETAAELEKWYASIKMPDTDKEVAAIRDRQLADLNNKIDLEEAASLAIFDFKKEQNEILRRNEITEADKTGASIQLINEKYAKMEIDLEGEKLQAKLQLAASVFGNMATIFGKQTAVGKAAAIAETTINTYASATASYKAMAGIPYVGPILGAIAAAAAIAAGLANVKQIMSVNTKIKGFSGGGYTGAGGKYEPAGFVHAGEWVANADMVKSPNFGPVIQALEAERVNGRNGYANGGNVGTTPSGSGGSGSSPTLIGSDPELKRVLKDLSSEVAKLRRDGVKTKFTYKTIDNIQDGMDTLKSVKDDVTM
jgi:hypothetical protein